MKKSRTLFKIFALICLILASTITVLFFFNSNTVNHENTQSEVCKIANEISTELNKDGTKLMMPEVKEGYSVEYLGADYEQVIDASGSVITPICNTDITVNFKVTEIKTGEYANSPDIKINVPGKMKSEIDNKPEVIPELQQWVGRNGDFYITNKSKIILNDEQFTKAAEYFAKDYRYITGKDISIVKNTDPEKGDFVFTSADENLDDETYYLDICDYVIIKADHNTGAYWATRSVLQILKQNKTTIPKGIAKDYPKYKVRGFMLDVGRLPVEFSFVKDLAKQMSWYKLNDFHLHLNDNSFGENSDGTREYAGFRLESDIPNLSSKDVVYSKDEFRQFILDSKNIGVNIVPEFDQPGHSAAFTRARPDIARGEETQYLDIENSEALEFIKSVFAEYMTGNNPVFPEGTVVHIGTDEYKNGNKEAFRAYQDALLKYIRDDLGYAPRVWGSQTENDGQTPITTDGIQMNIWNVNYSDPEEMYEKGYNMINTDDSALYIVPRESNYPDYIDQKFLYEEWKPNVFKDYKLPLGCDQMLGATFALWNDNTGKSYDNGTTDQELFDRINDIIHIFGSKLWGETDNYSLEKLNCIKSKVNIAPNANPLYFVESKTEVIVNYDFNESAGNDSSVNGYNFIKENNVEYINYGDNTALKLKGDNSYVETPISDIGIGTEENSKLGTTVEFWLNREDAEKNEQILFASEKGTFMAVQEGTGKMGYSRYQRDYTFDYSLPVGEWVHIKLVDEFTKTTLYVNDQLVDVLQNTEEDGDKWATLVFPLKKIGSEKNGFTGMIDNIVITRGIKD